MAQKNSRVLYRELAHTSPAGNLIMNLSRTSWKTGREFRAGSPVLAVCIVLIALLVLPAGVAALPNLIITAIQPNYGAGAEMFANEPNVLTVTVRNSGTADAESSTLSVTDGGTVFTATVGALTAGSTTTVTVTDSTIYTGGSEASITAMADSAGAIDESDESDNEYSANLNVYNNGYKGKRYTGGNDMNTQATFDGRYDVIYSSGDSSYKSNKWTSVTDTWTSANLPVPTGASVVSARLYQPWGWNKMTTDPAFTASFNGVTVSPVASYKDTKGFGMYNYPYGLMVYDVTGQFSTEGNSLVLTPEGTAGVTNDYLLWGAYLIVTYSDDSAPEKQIRINDEFDMVASSINAQTSYKWSTTDTEATVYAPFSSIDAADIARAQAVAIVAEASDSGRSRFYFNSNEYTGFWADYLSTPNIGFSVFDVTTALVSGSNTARLQSYDTGSGGDNFYALNTILVVEKADTTVSAEFTGTPVSGTAPLEVTFTDQSTNNPTSWAWDFGDGGTSTERNPVYIYETAGTYTVTLTASNSASTDTETKEGLVTVTAPLEIPVAGFNADTTGLVTGQKVTFTDQSTNSPTSWAWDFNNDGTVDSTAQNPVYVYVTSGTYSVKLTATNSVGSDDEVKTDYITVTGTSLAALPGYTAIPRDLNGDWLYEDMNGNGGKNMGDIVLFFNNVQWMKSNEPVAPFDFNGNGRIDLGDVIVLFNT